MLFQATDECLPVLVPKHITSAPLRKRVTHWTAEQVENMIKWGNEKANKYWEARLPENSIPNENTSGIDPWIRSKYEWKQFAGKGPIPDPADLGPIDEAMLADLHGRSGARLRVQMDRSSETPGSFGTISPPPSTPTRPSTHRPTTSLSAGGHGGDVFSIGQPQHHQRQQQQRPTPAPQEDFFGLNEPTPTFSTDTSAQNQTQVNNNKRMSVPPPPLPPAKQNSAAQDLFSMNNSSTAPAPSGQGSSSHPAAAGAATTTSQVQSKAGNVDWKNSIMSLYGNQSSAGNRTSTGFIMGQQQQQQRPQSGQSNQVQGMNSFGYGQQQQHNQQYQQQPQQPNTFGFGQQQQQQYQQQQQQQQQQNMWGGNNSNGFGSMQHAALSFGSGHNNNNKYGGQSQTDSGAHRPMSGNFGNNNHNNQQGVSQGGDFFDMIASATKSTVTSPPTQNNKTSSAFGDLSWN
ncbi:hypothetical protein BGZ95_000039 [Linnemannia exigua]|uniref:Arf-GAP domain-containing protein n=1 Tax=Linnemannia exigua TaxID=604196 RepID=A0AAD4HCB6_9FUNG|nr:hypothetical protein BGZ95_000039 [Linnemannia exigua]